MGFLGFLLLTLWKVSNLVDPVPYPRLFSVLFLPINLFVFYCVFEVYQALKACPAFDGFKAEYNLDLSRFTCLGSDEKREAMFYTATKRYPLSV